MADTVEKKEPETHSDILDIILTSLEDRKILCTVIFINGFQMHSVRFLEHDNRACVIKRENRQEVIFQHAISTIQPFSPVYREKSHPTTNTRHIFRAYERDDGNSLIVEADVHTDESGRRVIENLTQHPDDEGGRSHG